MPAATKTTPSPGGEGRGEGGPIRGPLDLPGYAEALASEQLARTVAFHGLSVTVGRLPSPAGRGLGEGPAFTHQPLTLRHYSALRLARSPFIPPFATPDSADVILFLWYLSLEFTPGSAAKRRFLDRCRPFCEPRKPFFQTRRARRRWEKNFMAALVLRAEIVHQCREFVAEAMQDRPARPLDDPDGIPAPDYYADEASVIGSLAREYGWTEDAILNLPLARAFQYLKEIREHLYLVNGKTPLLTNRSDEILQEYLAQVNARKTPPPSTQPPGGKAAPGANTEEILQP